MKKQTYLEKKQAMMKYHYNRKARLNIWRNYFEYWTLGQLPTDEKKLEDYKRCDYLMKYTKFEYKPRGAFIAQ